MAAPVFWFEPDVIEWQNDKLPIDRKIKLNGNPRFIRLPELKTIVGMSRSSIYRQIEAGKFPKPHLLVL